MRQGFVGNGSGMVLVSKPVVGMVQNERGSGRQSPDCHCAGPGSVPWLSIWGFVVLGQAFRTRLRNCEYRLHSGVSVCPSARNYSATTWRIFTKFDIWLFFETLSRKFLVSLKSDNNNGHFTWRPMYFCDSVSLNSEKENNIFRRKLWGEVRKQFMCSINVGPVAQSV